MAFKILTSAASHTLMLILMIIICTGVVSLTYGIHNLAGPFGVTADAQKESSQAPIGLVSKGTIDSLVNNTLSTPATSNNVAIRESTYENATLGLKINYPPNWVIKRANTDSPTLSIAAILFPRDDNNSAFTIGVQDLHATGSTSISDYANITIAKYNQDVINFQPTLFKTNGTLSGHAAYEIDGTYTDTNSEEREFFEIGTLLNNNKAYIFQFDSPKTLSPNYLPDVAKIVQSILINPTANKSLEAPIGKTNVANAPIKGLCRSVTIDSVSASGFEKDPKDYNPPEHAIDGDSSTWWSNKAIPSWFKVELLQPVVTRSLEIAWNKGDERIYEFTVSISSDSQSYTDVYRGKSSGKSLSYEKYDLGNSSSSVKFIKLSFTGTSSKSGWVGIRDLRVLGSMK
jgi:hypothetical protein